MLESLHLRDFQIHTKLDLDLGHPVVSIVGSSDVGKSAVVRALRFLCQNQPAGDSFIATGAERTKVSAVVDGKRITRIKGKGVNSYILDGKRLDFDLTGRKVPEEVAKLLRIGDVNLQHQFDPPYWLTLSPGQLSRELNEVINLDAIDSALASIASDLRGAKGEEETHRTALAGSETAQRELAWVPAAQRVLGAAEALTSDAGGKRGERERLESLISALAINQGEEKELSSKLKGMSAVVQGIRDAEQELGKVQDKRAGLEQLAEAIEQGEQKLCQVQECLRTAVAERTKLIGKECPLCLQPIPTTRS